VEGAGCRTFIPIGKDPIKCCNEKKRSDQIYSTILKEGAINSRQSFLLMYVHEEMAKIVSNYRDLAVRLGLRDDSFRYDQSTLNAYKIVRFFHGREDEGTVRLDPSMRDHISAFREFHLSWQAAVGQGETSYHVDDASWYRMLEAIESNTNAFLAEHQINALDDL
jgi:hypothetical protein